MNPFEVYLQNNQQFMADLNDRNPDEIKYDNIILNELRRGKSFKQAFESGKKKYPQEAWCPGNEEEFNQLEIHYNYLLEHEGHHGQEMRKLQTRGFNF